MSTTRAATPLAAAAAALALTALAPSTADADILTFYAGGKADYVSGAGDVYKRFDSSMGYGAFMGLEVVGLELWADALIMGDGQYLFTTNLGVDLSLGDEIRFIIGLDTGPMIFRFREQNAAPLVIPNGVRNVIGEDTASEIENEYEKYRGAEEEASRWAVGWNVVRGRLRVEHQLGTSFAYLGLGGNIGYHYLLNGEDVAADSKSGAIDQLEAEYPEAQRLGAFDELREVTDARELDVDELHGLNYNFGIYLRLEI